MNTKGITQLEMTDDDLDKAEAIAKRLGWTQCAYTSSSALIGLFCLRNKNDDTEACIVKTKEFGFLLIQNLEDLNLSDEFAE